MWVDLLGRMEKIWKVVRVKRIGRWVEKRGRVAWMEMNGDVVKGRIAWVVVVRAVVSG